MNAHFLTAFLGLLGCLLCVHMLPSTSATVVAEVPVSDRQNCSVFHCPVEKCTQVLFSEEKSLCFFLHCPNITSCDPLLLKIGKRDTEGATKDLSDGVSSPPVCSTHTTAVASQSGAGTRSPVHSNITTSSQQHVNSTEKHKPTPATAQRLGTTSSTSKGSAKVAERNNSTLESTTSVPPTALSANNAIITTTTTSTNATTKTTTNATTTTAATTTTRGTTNATTTNATTTNATSTTRGTTKTTTTNATTTNATTTTKGTNIIAAAVATTTTIPSTQPNSSFTQLLSPSNLRKPDVPVPTNTTSVLTPLLHSSHTVSPDEGANPSSATATQSPSGDTGRERIGQTVLEAAGEPLTARVVNTSSLMAVLMFGVLFFTVTVILFLRQAYESYRRKDYTQVDYLINGMYSDSGV